jgi:hypothetical protein
MVTTQHVLLVGLAVLPAIAAALLARRELDRFAIRVLIGVAVLLAAIFVVELVIIGDVSRGLNAARSALERSRASGDALIAVDRDSQSERFRAKLVLAMQISARPSAEAASTALNHLLELGGYLYRTGRMEETKRAFLRARALSNAHEVQNNLAVSRLLTGELLLGERELLEAARSGSKTAGENLVALRTIKPELELWLAGRGKRE